MQRARVRAVYAVGARAPFSLVPVRPCGWLLWPRCVHTSTVKRSRTLTCTREGRSGAAPTILAPPIPGSRSWGMPAPPLSRLLDELKRRNVFRAAGVYGATAFVVIQAADVIFPSIPLPPWTVSLVVWLCLLGFPVAILLAWAFERTPEGLRRTDEAADGELEAIVRQPASLRWPAGVAALVGLGLLIAGGWWALRGPLAGNASYESIAVLPFVDLSAGGSDTYFGDGLAEELLNALAGIPDLKVAARTSSFAFRSSELDVREIGRGLDVETVVEGSVRRADDSLRVTAQLVDATTGYRLWSDEYHASAADIFRVQEALARSIVDALAVQLRGDTPERLFVGGTEDPAAYDLYLEARQLWTTREMPKLWSALEKFNEAIARDSAFAAAWSGRADALDAIAWRMPEARDSVPAAKYAAQRALVLEPELAEGWASLGVLANDFDLDWRVAELALRRAIELRPSYSTAHHWLADVYRWQGDARKSLGAGLRAIELSPLSMLGRDGQAQTLVMLGDWDGARELYIQLAESGSDDGSYVSLLSLGPRFGLSADELERYARLLFRNGGWDGWERAGVMGRAIAEPKHRPEALAVLAEFAADGGNLRDVAELAVALGDHEAAFAYLERAEEVGWPLAPIGVDAAFDPLRDDPRMAALTARLRVPNGYDPVADSGS